MIPQIKEIEGKFPKYATLSQATVTLNDMGDKTISTQIKIDGSIAPDFSYDWEVEFQGERYIQPLREPQASKGNDSICSVIDLTFYHKTIYDLKRYFFVEMASTGSGTAIADKYIADLNVNIEQFKVALQNVLDFYFKGENRIEVKLYSEGTGIYAEEPQYVQIQYTHIWDVVQKIYDLFGVRWSIEGREIKIGYPTEEVAHTFEYGFEGGLLKVERQVQSADIRNSLLGRGGSKNLPYRYFKETDANNPSFQGDPDAIPELANIYFAELRGKSFRDYVKGWKARHYDGELMVEPTEAYIKGYTDEKFNPIEYVEDKDSIAKYGLLQGGLENQEDIYPTIQGVEVDGLGRIDEIVGADKVEVDEVTDKTDSKDEKYTQEIKGLYTQEVKGLTSTSTIHCSFRSDTFETADNTIVPYLISDPNLKVTAYLRNRTVRCGGTKYEQCAKYYGSSSFDLDISNLSVRLYFEDSDEVVTDMSKLEGGVKYYVKLDVDVKGFKVGEIRNELRYDGVTNTYWGEVFEILDYGEITIDFDWVVQHIPYHGLVLKGSEDNYKSIEIEKNKSKSVVFNTETFQVPNGGATSVSVPINIVTTAQGLYNYETTVKAVNAKTNEKVSSINIPEGEYYLEVSVEITNNSTKTEQFKVELLTAYIVLPTDSEEFKPTFNIWVKNIWNTTRNEGENKEAYTNRVWTPILGDREGNEAKVVFTTGWLAGHSDYEFVIRSVEYAGGSGVELNGVPAEWKIELIKSDAELEATGKWIPSTTQQAVKGDKFFFIGIDMPHEYTLWAEQAVDNYKSDQLLKTAHIKPTWVVQTDKVRLNQLQEGESDLLLNALKIGNSLRLADTRFTNGVEQTLYLQSVTYTWQQGTNIVPDVEVVLSDKITTSTNPVAMLQGEVDALTKQVGSISNIQQVVRAVGDKLYLRKDGFEDTSNSLTKFNTLVSSRGYRQGAVGGNGWGLRSEQGKGIIEVDKLIVRDEMQVNSLVVNQVSAIGGKEIFSAASITCSRVETTERGFKCYFDQKRGSIANLFQVHDVACSQVFNANDIEVKYYKREVIEVGANYILLSLEGDGDGAPQKGDVIAQYGNTADLNRQYVIIRDVIGGGFERMLSDLNSVSAEGVEYYFAGRIEGNTPRWFVGNNKQFIEYKDGHLQINADVTLGRGSSGLSDLEEFQELTSKVDDAQQTASQAIQDAANAILGAKNYTDEAIKDIQDQLDGKVDAYFYEYDPTADNLPASEWITDELKAAHLNDTFTNIVSGLSWRWLFKDNKYQWVPIADTQSTEALAKAQEALDVANGKVTIFTEEPRSPYKIKDIWLQGDEGRIKMCINSRTTTGEFYESDWVNADNYKEYTDQQIAQYKSEVESTISSLNKTIEDVEKAAENYTDEAKAALQESINALNEAKANIADVYTQAAVDGIISSVEQEAINAAKAEAEAAKDLALELAKAYADGEISKEEAARIKQAEENLKAAQNYAEAKANEAKEYTDQQIGTIEYLKNAFPQGAILDVNGVSLSSLMGVKDDNGNIVAGIYGGGSKTLNDNGFKDRIGTIMMFAGASNIDQPQGVQQAKFKVLSNGLLVAKGASISGDIVATSGQFGDYSIGKKTIGGSSVGTIENNTSDETRLTISPYDIEYAAKHYEDNFETGGQDVVEYGTKVQVGSQLGNGFTESTQVKINTVDKLDNLLGSSHNASLRIDCQGLEKYEGIGDPSGSYGNHAIMIDRGNICGLRLQMRRLTASYDEITFINPDPDAILKHIDVKNANMVSKYDCVIATSSTMTLVLPKDAEDGQLYYFTPYQGTLRVQVHPFTLDKMHHNQESADTTYKDLATGRMHTMIYDAYNKLWLVSWFNSMGD